jgi:alpha-tubulin suppressor-like RCC1 family protein
MIIAESGNVWTWGYNYYGQLGTGNTTEKLIPHKVEGIQNPKSIASVAHTCFVVTSTFVLH